MCFSWSTRAASLNFSYLLGVATKEERKDWKMVTEVYKVNEAKVLQYVYGSSISA